MAFPPGFLDELRARIGLADLVGRQVRLTRKGREYGGLCPFHNEKTPSFYVVEDKGFFHCFGCGAHGDAIGYVMRAENLDFIEAVERLAREYLTRRGLDEETIRRFRLGWAPDERQALRRSLGGDFPEALLHEAGLL